MFILSLFLIVVGIVFLIFHSAVDDLKQADEDKCLIKEELNERI